jgi:hypothetical protein
MRDRKRSLAFGMANRANEERDETQQPFSDASTVLVFSNPALALVSAK